MGKRITSKPSDGVSWWTDEAGVTHVCESALPLGNELLTWTLCDHEVEAGAAFAPGEHDAMSCSKCAAAEAVLERRRVHDKRSEASLASAGPLSPT